MRVGLGTKTRPGWVAPRNSQEATELIFKAEWPHPWAARPYQCSRFLFIRPMTPFFGRHGYMALEGVAQGVNVKRGISSSTPWIQYTTSKCLLQCLTTRWEPSKLFKKNTYVWVFVNIHLFFFSFNGHTCGIWKFPGWGWIRAAAANIHHSHSNTGFKLHLQFMRQLVAMPDA